MNFFCLVALCFMSMLYVQSQSLKQLNSLFREFDQRDQTLRMQLSESLDLTHPVVTFAAFLPDFPPALDYTAQHRDAVCLLVKRAGVEEELCH